MSKKFGLRLLVVAVVLAALSIGAAILAHAAGSYGISGTRLYKFENSWEYDQMTGYSKQSGSFQQVMHWWTGTTDDKDTLIDTIYTDWMDLGVRTGLELYSLKVIPSLNTVDTVASWDSTDSYTFALQTCLNPRTSDSIYISTIPVFAALTDTGTKVWFCPADSGLLNITYWTQFVRMQLIINAKIDTASASHDSVVYTQSFYIPVEYDVFYKPAWR